MAATHADGITLEWLRARRLEILRVASQYGASNIRVVGSVARGEARPDSDVDLLVTVPTKSTVFDLVGLWLDLKDLLGCEVSLIPDSASDTRFIKSVLKDAVPL